MTKERRNRNKKEKNNRTREKVEEEENKYIHVSYSKTSLWSLRRAKRISGRIERV
jgi:hypothetical protein